MTSLLISLFVPSNADDKNPAVRARFGLLAGVVGIAANLLLFLGKLLVGVAISSVSVMADSFNNLSDAGSSVITLAGFRVSGKPPDAEHPFGHGRAEYIVSLIIAFLILLLGYEFLKSSVTQIMNPTPVSLSWLSLAVLIAAVLVKLWLCLFYRTCGRRIRSSALLAVSTDSRNDVIVTMATIASVLVSRLTGLDIDGYVGVLVALILLYSGWKIAKDAASPLLGEPAGHETAEEIHRVLLAFNDIRGLHDLIVHDYGSGHIIASIHAEILDTMPLTEAHTIIDRAERAVNQKLGILIVIHIDPVDIHNPKLNSLKAAVEGVLSGCPAVTAHDFRLAHGRGGERRFLFDLEPRHNCSEAALSQLETAIAEACAKIDPSVVCVIRVEYGYVASETPGE